MAATICHMNAVNDFDVRELGERLFLRRRQLHLDQETVADRAGMSRAYISRLERGAIPNPKIADLMAVADALKTNVDALIRETPNSPEDVADLDRLTKRFAGKAEFISFLRRAEERMPNDERLVLRALRLAEGMLEDDEQ